MKKSFNPSKFLALSLLLIFIGCGKDDEDDKPKNGGNGGDPVVEQLDCEASLSIEEVTYFTADIHLTWECEEEPEAQRIGVAYAVNQAPSEGDSIVWSDELEENTVVVLGDLMAETTYYVKMVIASEKDRWYSSAQSFTTEAAPTYVYDIDNNQYPTVFINGREWMASSLRTTKYNDGTSILYISDLQDWPHDSLGVYTHYNFNAANTELAGALYNWQAVNTGKLCPQGWSVPTAQEFIDLSTYLGGDAVAGGPLKKTNTIMWRDPNRDATNATGFSAGGGGIVYHEIFGSFGSIGVIGPLWSSTEHDADRAYYRLLHFNDGHFVSKRGKKTHGMCVRCVRDE